MVEIAQRYDLDRVYNGEISGWQLHKEFERSEHRLEYDSVCVKETDDTQNPAGSSDCTSGGGLFALLGLKFRKPFDDECVRCMGQFIDVFAVIGGVASVDWSGAATPASYLRDASPNPFRCFYRDIRMVDELTQKVQVSIGQRRFV
ncbi:MAG: hypothetical protein ABI273_12960 [Lacunisphaera sp.]